MVNKKPLIIAGIMGIIAVALVFSYLKKVEQSTVASDIEYGKVVVASTQIPVRTRVREPMVEEIIVPVDAIHPDAIREVDEVLGKVTNQVIFEEEQILNAKFQKVENLRELAFIIDEGKRGISVGISDISGLGGNVKPGDHVDVIAVFDSKITGVDSSFTILSDIMIKAVDQSLGPEEEEAVSGRTRGRTVTLEVTPQQAERLVLADERGTLRLSLRHPDEIYTPMSPGTGIYDVVKWFDPPEYDKKPAQEKASEPMPKYPDFFNNTPQPASVNEKPEISFDFIDFNPVERIKVEIILGGEVQEIIIEKPLF